MVTLAPFTLGMIEAVVRNLYGKALTDNERERCEVRFGHDNSIGCGMLFELSREGDESFPIYSIRCYTDRRYETSDFTHLLARCNTWNAESRWPKAALETYASDDGSEEEGQIVLEQHVPLSGGAYVGLIEETYMAVYYASVNFWKQMNGIQDEADRGQ